MELPKLCRGERPDSFDCVFTFKGVVELLKDPVGMCLHKLNDGVLGLAVRGTHEDLTAADDQRKRPPVRADDLV